MSNKPLPTEAELAAKIICKSCRSRMTWAQQRVQFGRMLKRGLNKEQAKLLLPQCQKCITRHLKNIAIKKEG